MFVFLKRFPGSPLGTGCNPPLILRREGSHSTVKGLRLPSYVCRNDARGATGRQWSSQFSEHSACPLQYLTQMGQFQVSTKETSETIVPFDPLRCTGAGETWTGSSVTRAHTQSCQERPALANGRAGLSEAVYNIVFAAWGVRMSLP